MDEKLIDEIEFSDCLYGRFDDNYFVMLKYRPLKSEISTNNREYIIDCKKVKKIFTNLDKYTFLYTDFIETGILKFRYTFDIFYLYNFETHKELLYWINKELYNCYKNLANIYNKLSDDEKLLLELEKS